MDTACFAVIGKRKHPDHELLLTLAARRDEDDRPKIEMVDDYCPCRHFTKQASMLSESEIA